MKRLDLTDPVNTRSYTAAHQERALPDKAAEGEASPERTGVTLRQKD